MAQPVTIVVRVIRNFEYRTVKNLIMHVPTDITVGDLKAKVLHEISSQAAFERFRSVHYDTLKKYTTYQGFKPNNLIINLENDEGWILKDSDTLAAVGIGNEAEVSLFNLADYQKYKQNPVIKWE